MFTVLLFATSERRIPAQEIIHIPGQTVQPGIVEVRSVMRRASHTNPWHKESYYERQGPGVFISEKYILTASLDVHSVVSVAVHLPRSGQHYPGRIVARDGELNVALIQIDSGGLAPPKIPSGQISILDKPEFLTRLKQLQSLGIGGPKCRSLFENRTIYLKGLMEKKIGRGNTPLPLIHFSSWESDIKSGDLVFSENTLIGIVSSFHSKKHRGFAVPAVFIRQFIEQVARTDGGDKKIIIENGTNKGMNTGTITVHPGFETLLPRSEPERKYFHIPATGNGVVVSRVFPFGSASGKLLIDDVILAVDGQAIGHDGSVRDEKLGRLPVLAAMTIRAGRLREPGSAVDLLISRKGVERNVKFELHPFSPLNFHVPPSYSLPRYAIIGGLVFIELSAGYVREKENPSLRLQYLVKRERFLENRQPERFVVLDRILKTEMTAGYDYDGLLVLAVNGVAVRGLKHLNRLIERAREKKFPIRILLEGNRQIFLPAEGYDKVEENIRKIYGIQFMNNLNS